MPSNTAERWWVKAFARWMARVQTVQGQLSLLFQGMSGVGIASGALKYLGAPLWMITILFILFVAGVITYIYVYAEHGVHNQKNRDLNDIGNNFAQPINYIDDVLIGVAVFAAQHGREPTDDELATITETVREQWDEYRDGMDIDNEF